MNNQVPLRTHLSSALKTLEIEMDALKALREALQGPELGCEFERAVEVFASARGRIIVTGMGKSGHVARKIAATLCSTGSSALYLHPGEASHGDLGIISTEDVVFAVTWSGKTRELSDIFHFCRFHGIQIVVATADPNSMAARNADIRLTLPVVREACPNELAPTSSTTMQMVLGDALAVALIETRGFSSGHFRRFHPGGRLGAQLATVGDIMGTGDAVPCIGQNSTLVGATIEMNRKRYGCTGVVDSEGRLVGAFTDGDLRRCIASYDLNEAIAAHMSLHPVTVDASMPCYEALALMNQNAVSVLFVTKAEKLVGIVHMHDIVRLGVE